MKHRADAYCPACGGQCQDAETVARQTFKPYSLPPAFTGPGKPSFRPTRKSGQFE